MKTNLNLESWAGSPGLESMIATVGGVELAQAVAHQRAARGALVAALDPEQRRLYVEASDAAQDAAGAREVAVQRVALAHGLAVGAALASCPGEPLDGLVEIGASVASVVIGAELDVARAQRIVGRVLEAVARVSS